MLTFIFGKLSNSKVFLNENGKASGFLEFENARVRWYLSLDFNDIPENLKKEQTAFLSAASCMQVACFHAPVSFRHGQALVYIYYVES